MGEFMRRSTLFAILVLFCSATQSRAQTVSRLSSEERTIIELQDARSLGNGVFPRFLQSESPSVLRRALIAIANIQKSDTLVDTAIIRLLTHPRVEIRAASALAAGQVGSSVFTQALFDQYKGDESVRVRFALAQAIGRSGTRNYLDSLLSAPNAQNDKLPIMEAIFRFGLRNIRSYQAISFCLDNLRSIDSAIVSHSLYTLWRILPVPGISDTMRKYVDLFRTLLRAPQSDVRMYTAALIGKLQLPEFSEELTGLIQSELLTGNWRVLYHATVALSSLSHPDSRRIEVLRTLLRHHNDHIKFAALQGLNRLRPDTLLAKSVSAWLRPALDSLALGLTNASPSVQGEAYVTLAMLGLQQKSDFALLNRKSADPLVRAKLVEAASVSRAISIPEFMSTLFDSDDRVAMSAWGFLPTYIRGFDNEDSSEIVKRLLASAEQVFESNSLPLITVASASLTESSVRRFLRRDDVQKYLLPLAVRSFAVLDAPDADETLTGILAFIGEYADTSDVAFLRAAAAHHSLSVATAAINALKKVGVHDISALGRSRLVRVITETDWSTLEELGQGNSKMIIRTGRGDIVIRLLPDDAPFTVLSMVRLAERKFFNGLTFHRVVPNFVIQGGDPLGVGIGGPGYSIRTEISETQFERGAVGMASAGKDTEGSQFFITQSAANHLDGKYTVWGIVEKGMEVVDAVQIGDRIQEVLILR